MAEDPLPDVVEVRIGEQRRAEFGLAADLRPLLVGERALLVQDLGPDSIAPDAAHERGEADSGDLRLVQLQLASGQLGEMPDEAASAGGVVDPFQFGLLGPAHIAHEHQSQLARLSHVACPAALQCGVIATHIHPSTARARACRKARDSGPMPTIAAVNAGARRRGSRTALGATP